MQIKTGGYRTKNGSNAYIQSKTRVGTWWGVVQDRGYNLWNDDGTERFGEAGLDLVQECNVYYQIP